MSRKSVIALFKQVEEDPILRQRLTARIEKAQEGDWTKLIEIARKEGYDFTAEELKEMLPQAFLKRHGKRPRSGRDVSRQGQ